MNACPSETTTTTESDTLWKRTGVESRRNGNIRQNPKSIAQNGMFAGRETELEVNYVKF